MAERWEPRVYEDGTLGIPPGFSGVDAEFLRAALEEHAATRTLRITGAPDEREAADDVLALLLPSERWLATVGRSVTVIAGEPGPLIATLEEGLAKQAHSEGRDSSTIGVISASFPGAG